jgi:y4mF family transcriptional regulator
MNNLKEAIRAHRRKSGLSQADLAKLAGVGKTVVFDMEHGKESIRLDTLGKVLSTLNMTLSIRGPLMASPEGIDLIARATDSEP